MAWQVQEWIYIQGEFRVGRRGVCVNEGQLAWSDRAAAGPVQIGDDDVVNGFVATGANHDRLLFFADEFFALNGPLTLVNGPAATAADGTFVFDGATSTLYWDQDGTGAIAKVKIVTLTGVTVLTDAVFDL